MDYWHSRADFEHSIVIKIDEFTIIAFANKKVDMGLLKCDVTMESSTFAAGNEIYADVREWPPDVKLLW